MFVLIDNYDSFTYNLYHFLGELGAEVKVWRNDAISVEAVLGMNPQGVILSPGPKTPDEAGICLEMVERGAGQVPILGVCLGHQAIGQAFGGKIVRGPKPMHGKVSHVSHQGKGIFADLPEGFAATRYHSLVIERGSAPENLEVTAETEDGMIMGVQHREHPIFGVQFHPESIASEHGHQLLGNFLRLAGHNDTRKVA